MTLETDQLKSIFETIQARWDERVEAGGGLVCKQGFYTNCHVVKLLKASWTNDGMIRTENQSGIFFSAWIGPEDASRNRAQYNIHALKMRELRGYAIASRDFASEFRAGFASMQGAWPNVSVDYGPQTLMQGWIEFEAKDCEKEIFALLLRFAGIARLIDDLLERRRR